MECPHRWVGLGEGSGYLACATCGQAAYIVVEFEYLSWTKEPLVGQV